MREHRVRKCFGQNFLQDACIIVDIVSTVRPQADDAVIEISPGLAVTTESLAKKLNCLHVIGIDRGIVDRLKALPFADKLVIREGDVLQSDFNGIAGKRKIADNPPYSISTSLLFRLAEMMDDVVEMRFMLQKEVVGRMVAASKSNNYGRLDMMLQYFFSTELFIDVPPESSDPAPKVDSAVMHTIPMKHRIGKAGDFEHFIKPVKLAFHQRRKTIHNNLKKFASDGDLQATGISPQDCAEHIAPEKYVELNNYLVHRAV